MIELKCHDTDCETRTSYLDVRTPYTWNPDPISQLRLGMGGHQSSPSRNLSSLLDNLLSKVVTLVNEPNRNLRCTYTPALRAFSRNINRHA